MGTRKGSQNGKKCSKLGQQGGRGHSDNLGDKRTTNLVSNTESSRWLQDRCPFLHRSLGGKNRGYHKAQSLAHLSFWPGRQLSNRIHMMRLGSQRYKNKHIHKRLSPLAFSQKPSATAPELLPYTPLMIRADLLAMPWLTLCTNLTRY